MRAVVQRVLSASVTVGDRVLGSFDVPGLVVLFGVTHADGSQQIAWMARKIWHLRIMREERSAAELSAPLLVVSQFTLYGDARKSRRPTWNAAAPRAIAEPVYDELCSELERLGASVSRGKFGADMRLSLVNDGPVTIQLET